MPIPKAGKSTKSTLMMTTAAQTAAALMQRIPDSAVHMVEIFNWDRLVASLPVLEALAQPHSGT